MEHAPRDRVALAATRDPAAFCNHLLETEPGLARDVQEALVAAQLRHDLVFQGRMLCTVLRPRFITREDAVTLAETSKLLADLFERAGSLLLASDTLLDSIGASVEERAIWAIDPGFPGFTLTSRLDAFMVDGAIRFIEYNAESPAGIGFSDRLTEIFSLLPATRRLLRSASAVGYDSRRVLFDTLLSAYHTWGGSGLPSIAVVDWENVLTRRDFQLCAEYFREQGARVVICDPRRLEYHHGKLWLGEQEITLVYRRVLLHELLDKAEEAEGLLAAYRDGAVCVANSPRSKLLHKKSVFALISDGTLGDAWTEAENSVIDRCIPWTRLLRSGTTTRKGEVIDLERFVLGQRERLVLKPADDYGGRGVVLGWEMTKDAWERAIEINIDQAYVVQERVDMPHEIYPVWQDEAPQSVSLIVDTNPLLFQGQMGGILTRMSGTALLNVSAGTGSTAPTFVTEGET